MASEQIAVRLPDTLLRELDELVASGTYASRAAAVRAGVEAVTTAQRRYRIDQAIVEGYGQLPQTAAEAAAAIASTVEAIGEEPW